MFYNEKYCEDFTIEPIACEIHVVENTREKINVLMSCG